MGRKAYEIGIIILVLALMGCSYHSTNFNKELGGPHNDSNIRTVPVRIFVQRDIINNACTQSKSDEVILQELMWAEQFCPELHLQFDILDFFYFNNIDNIEEHELSAHYSDSLNIFYYFPTINSPSGYADYPWIFPATVKIYGVEYDPRLLMHELGHQFSLKHVHKDSSENCAEDGCSDTDEIPLTIDEMNKYPNIMTYSRSEYYFLTPQQIERAKLWYTIRFVYKVYGPELTNPLDYSNYN